MSSTVDGFIQTLYIKFLPNIFTLTLWKPSLSSFRSKSFKYDVRAYKNAFRTVFSSSTSTLIFQVSWVAFLKPETFFTISILLLKSSPPKLTNCICAFFYKIRTSFDRSRIVFRCLLNLVNNFSLSVVNFSCGYIFHKIFLNLVVVLFFQCFLKAYVVHVVICCFRQYLRVDSCVNFYLYNIGIYTNIWIYLENVWVVPGYVNLYIRFFVL